MASTVVLCALSVSHLVPLVLAKRDRKGLRTHSLPCVLLRSESQSFYVYIMQSIAGHLYGSAEPQWCVVTFGVGTSSV